MQILEEKYPNNGLNRDDDARVVPVNESRFILNLRGGSSEGDNTGSIENIKGTTEVVFDLPSGSNVCIKSYGDQTTHTNFFFVYNSLGQHTIYRYFPEDRTVRILVRDPLLNFTEFDLINDVNVVDDMIYWRDYENAPRKINFNKADNDDPKTTQTFNWYLGDNYLLNETSLDLEFSERTLRYDADSTATFTTITLPLNAALTEKADISRDLADKINTGVANNSIPLDIIADACGEFVEIKTTNFNFFTIIAQKGGNDTAQVVPQDHYINYVERTIDVIKHPPHCELKGTIKTDDTFQRNYLKDKVFQIAAKYIYDDDEKSTVSPYSTHIYNNFVCSQNQGDNINNYIEIDISVLPEINDLIEVQTIKRIELFVREGELGLWKSIKTLEQFEFIDTSNQKFDFYNDGIYNTVDQDDFVRPFDLVPQRTKNQEVVKNRMFYGNNLEGYDNVCIDTELDVTYNDIEASLKVPTYSVGGVISIRNTYSNNPQSQPIWKNQFSNNNETVWGGFGLINDMATKNDQILPLNGFTVYLAGTDFHATSKQIPGLLGGHLSQDPNGVYIPTASSPNQNNFVTRVLTNINNGLAVSFFEIKDVPDGYYILRVASHKTTQADLEDENRTYQRTSTNVFKMANTSPPSGATRSETAGKNELLVHVQGGNITTINIDIMDLSGNNSRIITGYNVDHDLPTSSTTLPYDFYIQDTRIARTKVSFNLPSNSPYAPLVYNPGFIANTGDSIVTDHNGYFFYSSNIGITLGINDIRSTDIQVVDYNPSLQVDQRGLSVTVGGENYRQLVVRVPNTSSTFPIRTKVTGKILDTQGKGIANSSVVAIRSEASSTDNNGNYEFFHYGILDFSLPNIGTFDTLLVATTLNSGCSAIYTNQIYDFGFTYSVWFFALPNPPIAPNNSTTTAPTLIIEVPAFVGNTARMFGINAMKRGWDGKFALEYTDRGMRGGAVNTEEKLSLHIPFYSEKAADGQLKTGVPVLNWEIKHRPPEWATHYQWVRTRNLSVGSYFQWTIKQVAYANFADGVYSFSTFTQGERVALNIDNYIRYRELNPSVDLQVDLESDTLRVRFIKDENGATFTKYVDSKVLDVITLPVLGTFIIAEKEFGIGELFPGVVVEVYNDLLDIEEDIYYEFGECFEVGTDANGNKFHKGITQDQDPLSPSLIPATGSFKTGDAYYRLRSIPDVSVNQNPFIDDDGVSDFYKSEVESIGRPNVENPDASRIWKINQIRHSGLFIPDSRVNNLSKFESSKFKPLSIEFGAIHKLQLASNILISIHEFRWVSNYIGETITRKQGGADELLATTDVFGSDRAAKDNTGTINQESVVEFRGNVWAWDMNKGIVNRWGADGLTAISEYKMIDYFTDKAKALLNNDKSGVDPTRVIAVYDPKHDEYIISFSQLNKRATTDDTASDDPTFRVNTEITNSEIIDDGTDDTLYSIKGDKPEGSNLIIDRGATPDLKGVQIDNRLDSKGILTVKVKNADGSIEDVTKLEVGQGISNFKASNKSFEVKTQTADNSTARLGTGEILVTGETLAFSERSKRWIYFASFRPEMFGIIDIEMLGFTNGKLWIHNDSETRNNFYGVQYPSQAEVISNLEPQKVKVFQAIAVESYNAWYVPSMKTPNGMETKIVQGRFVRREDSFFAPVTRDINTPNIANANEGIINGRQLRDRSAVILLQNDDTTEVVLFSVGIQLTLSPRHGK